MRFCLALSLLALAGCDCAGQPDRSCTDEGDCRANEICVDDRCEPAPDVPAFDAPSDGADPIDVPVPDTSFDANCIVTECLATEGCGDGLDEDCDGNVDEDCACVVGSTARCLPGRLEPGVTRCSFGEMACVGDDEFGSWGPCSGGGDGIDGGTSLYGCRRIGILGAPGALASSNFQAWLETQGAIATRIHTTVDAPTLRREELDTFDLVVIDWLQRLYTTAESQTLTDWVMDGGGLIAMSGHDSGATADRHVSLLATLGPNYERIDEPLNGPATLVVHPTTLAEDGVSALPPVTFNGGMRVFVPEALRTDIVTMAVIGSEVVGAAGPLGEGRVLLFGDEWIEFDSEWSTMPPIPRFWQNSVQWIAPDEPVLPACE